MAPSRVNASSKTPRLTFADDLQVVSERSTVASLPALSDNQHPRLTATMTDLTFTRYYQARFDDSLIMSAADGLLSLETSHNEPDTTDRCLIAANPVRKMRPPGLQTLCTRDCAGRSD
ncbi:hypothetical protein PLUA15_220208 [Pseudomonas lundensis]|uniref:Uncharacterized protein n=1 Tax=Pseudomonas lundensis TaxID=86185 RepID=A0AAX2H733_9PSED|nr:hypothetical protein PLUA15_220208 [Pseudomonas lundensis]